MIVSSNLADQINALKQGEKLVFGALIIFRAISSFFLFICDEFFCEYQLNQVDRLIRRVELLGSFE
jgi:hypothetical protein